MLGLLSSLVLLVAVVQAQLEQMPPTFIQTGRRSECPTFCTCSTWLRLPKASCTGKNLYSIQTGVSNVVQALDLSNNLISKLEDRELSRAGLTKLKYLNLSMNTISEIGTWAFEDLKNLMVLDLSMNHIDFIPPETFYYNKKLQILSLAGNKFNAYVPKIHSLSITNLDLSGCQINHLSPDIFAELKQLHKLNLSNNQLTQMDKEVLFARPSLQHLMLGRNPWECNGAFFSLKIYMRKAKIRLDQVCEKPTLEAKFEKIISKSLELSGAVVGKTTSQPEPRAELNEPWDVESWREFEDTISEEDEQPAEFAASNVLVNALSNVSPLWLLLSGFFLGCGATMLVTYLWLSTTISCLIPRIRRAETANSPEVNSQRISLLRHLWQQENLAGSEETSRGANETGPTIFLPGVGSTPSCPGTPPPPYREVMLHRNLYPRAAMVAAAQQASARSASAN